MEREGRWWAGSGEWSVDVRTDDGVCVVWGVRSAEWRARLDGLVDREQTDVADGTRQAGRWHTYRLLISGNGTQFFI